MGQAGAETGTGVAVLIVCCYLWVGMCSMRVCASACVHMCVTNDETLSCVMLMD